MKDVFSFFLNLYCFWTRCWHVIVQRIETSTVWHLLCITEQVPVASQENSRLCVCVCVSQAVVADKWRRTAAAQTELKTAALTDQRWNQSSWQLKYSVFSQQTCRILQWLERVWSGRVGKLSASPCWIFLLFYATSCPKQLQQTYYEMSCDLFMAIVCKSKPCQRHWNEKWNSKKWHASLSAFFHTPLSHLVLPKGPQRNPFKTITCNFLKEKNNENLN